MKTPYPFHAESPAACTLDQVPEFDLGGCWPLWPQFSPDERKFLCERTWTIDPAYSLGAPKRSRVHQPPPESAALACWQTCWRPMPQGRLNRLASAAKSVLGERHHRGIGSNATGGGSGPIDGFHCTAPCPTAAQAQLPRVWRAGWDRELAHWRGSAVDGRAFAKLAELFKAQATSHWHQNYLRAAIFRVF